MSLPIAGEVNALAALHCQSGYAVRSHLRQHYAAIPSAPALIGLVQMGTAALGYQPTPW